MEILDVAMKGFEEVPSERRLENFMGLRERGILSASEYYYFAEQMGITESDAERRYRKWEGSTESIWVLKEKGLLNYGELSKLIRTKRLSQGQAYRSYRIWQHEQGIRPYRRFPKRRRPTP